MENNELNRDKYSEKIVALVQECTKELLELAKKYQIKHIDFDKHNIEQPSATFNNDDNISDYEEIRKITFNPDGTIVIELDFFSSYLDNTYGDYFDVAQSLPLIYAAVIDCITEGIRQEEHLPEIS